VEDNAAGLAVQMAINQPATFDPQGNGSLGGPANEVRQQVSVVRQVVAAKTPIQVGWQESDTAP